MAINHVRAISEGRERVTRQVPIAAQGNESQKLIAMPGLPTLPASSSKRGSQAWTTVLTRWQKWQAYQAERDGISAFEVRRRAAMKKKQWREQRRAKVGA